MSNRVDVIIGAEVSGALQGLQKVEAATVKAGATINKLPASVNAATQALEKIPVSSTAVTSALSKLSNLDFSGNFSAALEKVNLSIDKMAQGALSASQPLSKVTNEVTLLQKQVSKFGGGASSFQLPAYFKKAGDSAVVAANSFKKLTPGSNEAGQSLINLSRVVQDAPYGFIGIANNINPLLESFQRLKTSTGTTGGALKALGKELTGGAGLGLAIGVASSLLVVFGDKLFGASKAAKEAKSASDALKDSISGIFSAQAKESAEVAGFIGILKNETETRERKLAAIKELQQIQPEVFNNLKLEGNAVAGLDAAYSNYLGNLKTVIAVKIKQAQLEQQIAELLKKQGVTLTQSEKDIAGFIENTEKRILDRAKRAGGAEGLSYIESVYGKKEKRKQDEERLKNDIDALLKDITSLSKGVKVKELNIKTDKIKFDFEGQFSDPITLAKPIPIQGRIFDFNTAQLGTDLLKKLEYEFGDRLKSMEKLVVTPKLNISESVKEGNEKLLEQFKQMRQVAEQVAGSVSNAFSNAFSQIAQGENVFESLGNAIKGVVVDLIQAAIKALIFKAVMNLILPGSGSATAGLGSLVGSFGGFRAAGGPVGQGRSYVVGENGPELFVPANSGRIMNGNQVAAMSYSGGGSSGGGRQIIRGQNIILSYARTNRAQNRLGRG